jgi:hypothetical protein
LQLHEGADDDEQNRNDREGDKDVPIEALGNGFSH